MTAPDRGARTSHRPCIQGAVHTWLGKFGRPDNRLETLHEGQIERGDGNGGEPAGAHQAGRHKAGRKGWSVPSMMAPLGTLICL
jgi:hypothetical protein